MDKAVTLRALEVAFRQAEKTRTCPPMCPADADFSGFYASTSGLERFTVNGRRGPTGFAGTPEDPYVIYTVRPDCMRIEDEVQLVRIEAPCPGLIRVHLICPHNPTPTRARTYAVGVDPGDGNIHRVADLILRDLAMDMAAASQEVHPCLGQVKWAASPHLVTSHAADYAEAKHLQALFPELIVSVSSPGFLGCVTVDEKVKFLVRLGGLQTASVAWCPVDGSVPEGILKSALNHVNLGLFPPRSETPPHRSWEEFATQHVRRLCAPAGSVLAYVVGHLLDHLPPELRSSTWVTELWNAFPHADIKPATGGHRVYPRPRASQSYVYVPEFGERNAFLFNDGNPIGRVPGGIPIPFHRPADLAAELEKAELVDTRPKRMRRLADEILSTQGKRQTSPLVDRMAKEAEGLLMDLQWGIPADTRAVSMFLFACAATSLQLDPTCAEHLHPLLSSAAPEVLRTQVQLVLAECFP